MKHFKQILAAALSVALLVSAAPVAFATEAEAMTANPTYSAILINGEAVGLEGYNIADNNYFKLRDFAMAVSGTEKQFDVTWNQEAEQVGIITGNAYTPVGGEMAAGSGEALPATEGVSGLYVDGIYQDAAAYEIKGNNYFKLRDLGRRLNIEVSWDEAANAIFIDTALSYTGLSKADRAFLEAFEDETILENYSATIRECPLYPGFDDVIDFGTMMGVEPLLSTTENTEGGLCTVYVYDLNKLMQQGESALIAYAESLDKMCYMEIPNDEAATVYVNCIGRIFAVIEQEGLLAVSIAHQKIPSEEAQAAMAELAAMEAE